MGESPRVVVVTGASRGIGAHLAAAFTAVGDLVEGCSLHGGGPVGEGSSFSLAAVDVTDSRSVADFVSAVERKHGRIDVLINNAGVIDHELPLEDSDPDQWWRTVEVNVRGPYLFTRRVLPGMLAAGSGRIINLNSGAGTRAGDVSSAYNVGKTALARITGSTHASGLGRGVCAFDLMPGVVRTDMTLSMRVHEGRSEWTTPQQVSELALGLASGRLDAWSGCFVRAGVDSVDSLLSAAAGGVPEGARKLVLSSYGEGDPIRG
ncbi:NAD(P)-dependent dehydrogenase, short-chain alcohol dehydrogenase family [Austwickia chelonae]|uniref:Putative oxidoreductase n=1 Tax=Austwickia chelonae NBRC 105200 TaxID=1184607 RepID=K6W3Q5_9MICO|nr:SDR family oxidoreductase [Austwickia chelonae]GAB76447.1 putative oxidoreductase [Austwickia chelonae NBRC 105200]SEW24843.1 NAD(P)-dependent dehydrogenase, short-chain alcohol dehydrogenase family [Austwickia chelonae]